MGLTPHQAAKDASVLSRSGHGDQESDGLADAHRYEQLRCVAFDEPGQALVQLIDLPGELFDALGEHAQGHMGDLSRRFLVSPAVALAEARGCGTARGCPDWTAAPARPGRL
ncbi:hypothetical protein N4G69_53380 [Streptomyces mirabilis]|uniref:hypothetical protein n=1 Tax=Streptomyces mirabilis TaxID=68239 RepID=UPI0021C02EF6|nr:hypothetical protein [Streptomyces mirabilis]MCT9114135.1 hypothetical protein [Streptomyces mirabilis]